MKNRVEHAVGETRKNNDDNNLRDTNGLAHVFRTEWEQQQPMRGAKGSLRFRAIIKRKKKIEKAMENKKKIPITVSFLVVKARARAFTCNGDYRKTTHARTAYAGRCDTYSIATFHVSRLQRFTCPVAVFRTRSLYFTRTDIALGAFEFARKRFTCARSTVCACTVRGVFRHGGRGTTGRSTGTSGVR